MLVLLPNFSFLKFLQRYYFSPKIGIYSIRTSLIIRYFILTGKLFKPFFHQILFKRSSVFMIKLISMRIIFIVFLPLLMILSNFFDALNNKLHFLIGSSWMYRHSYPSRFF